MTLLLIGLLLTQEPAEPQVIVDVELRLPSATDPELVKQVPDLVALRKGQRLTLRAVQRTIERLMDSGGFADVVVTGEEREGGLAIVITAAPKLKVGEVFCEGCRNLKSPDVVAASKLLKGLELTPDSLNDAVEAVRNAYRRKGYLHASARAVTTPGDTGVDVTLQVSEGWPTRLTAVVFAGDSGLPAHELLTQLSLEVGDIVDQEKVEKAADRLRELFRAKRFYRARVDAPVLNDNGRLTLAVKAGPQYATRYRGNRRFPDAVLDAVYGYDGSEALDRNVLDRMESKLTAFYRYHGFHDAQVNVRESVSPSGHKGVIVAEVEEGQPLTVDHVGFEGNQAVSSGELESVLRAVMQSGAPVGARLNDAYSDALHLQGRTKEPALYDLPSPPLEAVLVDEAYRDAALAMRTLYHDRGYLDAKVELKPVLLHGQHTTVGFAIVEGRRVTFDAVKYEGGPEGFPPTSDKQWVLGGQPFSQRTVERVRQALATELARRGYTYATVEGEWRFDEAGQADVAFTMTPGPQVHVGKIFVRGLYRTSETVVRGQLVIAEGRTLNPDDLLDSQRNLITLGIFKTVDVRLLSPEKAEAVKDVLIEVQEGKRLTGEFDVGYFLAEGIRVVLDGVYPNMFGEAVAAQGHLQVYYFGSSALAATRAIDVSSLHPATLIGGTGNLSLVKRGLFGVPELSGRVNVIAERVFRPSFQFSRVAADLPGIDWSRRFRTGLDRIPQVKLALQFQNELDLSYEVPESNGPQQVDATLSSVIDVQRLRFPYGTYALYTPRAGVTVDMRDNPVLPHFGMAISGSVEPTFKLYAVDLSGNDQHVEFLKVQGQVSGYIPLGPSLTFAVLMRGGYIFPLVGDNITPGHKRFFVGGAQSLRGFSEDGLLSEDQRRALHGEVGACHALANNYGCTQNAQALLAGRFVPSTGGQSFGVGKAELRFPFIGDINMGVFFELGNLWQDQPSALTLRPVAGTGLRYLSPIGPLALDVGFNLLPDAIVNESAFNVHFNVGVF